METATAEVTEECTSLSAKRSPRINLNKEALLAALYQGPIGTGGVANLAILPVDPGTGSAVRLDNLAIPAAEEEPLRDVHEKLAGIRHYLSLPVKSLADVLRVRRPTVYSWMANKVQAHEEHRERIDRIYGIAREWRSLSSEPMGRLRDEQLRSGKTLVELLSSEKLDTVAIREGMKQIKDLQNRTERRLSVLERANRAGLQLAAKPRRNWRSNGQPDM